MLINNRQNIQLELPYKGDEIDVDRIYDKKHPNTIRYVGKATKQLDGKYRCLATVEGLGLCLVEVNITESTEEL